MIKIEITDPQRENPDVLVKLASFLMDCAGHTMVKAPQEVFKEPTVLTVNEIPEKGHRPFEIHDEIEGHNFHDLIKPIPQNFEVQGVEQTYKPCVETYQHCAESDLTTYTKCEETGLTQVSEEHLKDELTDILTRAATPKKRKHKSASEIIKKLETEMPPLPEIAPPPPVNGNTLVDKILMAKTEGKLTHEEVTAIARKHGLSAIKDIFTNDHLIPLIDADLDEALRGK